VLKRFPRLSETFIVNEVLALERLGIPVEIFSLREPRAEPRHEMLRALRAPVTYLPDKTALAACTVREGNWQGPGRERALSELLADPRAEEDTLVDLQASALALLAARRGVTHLHAHFGTGATRVAMLASRLSGLPYSFTAHAKDIYHEDVDQAALAEKISGARFVITVSDFNRRHLAQRFGPALSRRVVRLYNGLDLERFTSDPGAAPEPCLVLAVGRLVEKKGFAYLLQACALLRDRRIPVRCLIVGDGPERDALVERIRVLALEPIVTLAGAQPQEHLLETMRRAAVLALPCVVSANGDRDGLPTVLLEALALGLPTVSTTLPGIEEIIPDRGTGRLVPPGDSAALADAIGEILQAPDLRQRLAKSGRARAEELFDIGKNSLVLADLFARPADRNGRPHLSRSLATA
jgi:colanic acid/amylovoran biosynthesis glycosyltransferase